ncbi:hypothetical protein AVEN_261239-1 [Araneus ventricosus]|uniref:Uncharacterized protein n=1 Tax=Araneus ventricosus TaxID=182803 RepID=A0A4Y2W2X2_ARAVE|nr:hypothetical protein AVEN_261239-1 [Araneus ventricosus]
MEQMLILGTREYYSLDGTGLNRSLQWCICLLQTNDLPLRHLLNSLDVATTGPKQFCRPIGKAIKTCEELLVAPFSSIGVDICQIILIGWFSAMTSNIYMIFAYRYHVVNVILTWH